MSLRYGFEFGVLVLPVLGSVDGVVVVDGLFTEGLVALGSVGRPEVDEPVVGALLPAPVPVLPVLGLAGLMAGDWAPVALSVPSVPVPLPGVVPMVPVEPTEEPELPTEEPVLGEPAAGAPVAAPPAAPPAPAPAPPAPDWANAPKAAREPEARIVAANLPSRIFVCSSVRIKLRTPVGIV